MQLDSYSVVCRKLLRGRLRAENTITIIRGDLVQQKKSATFKYSLKKTIKIIYLFLILLLSG